MYEGTVRMIMEYGATSLEHMEHLEKRELSFFFSFRGVNPRNLGHFEHWVTVVLLSR